MRAFVNDNSFSSCCWISLSYGGSPSWSLWVRFNLAIRPDTGLINSSPVSSIAPIVRIQYNCDITIQIPGIGYIMHCISRLMVVCTCMESSVQDVDGDDVRCRWAVGSECGGVCQTFPGGLLSMVKQRIILLWAP